LILYLPRRNGGEVVRRQIRCGPQSYARLWYHSISIPHFLEGHEGRHPPIDQSPPAGANSATAVWQLPHGMTTPLAVPQEISF